MDLSSVRVLVVDDSRAIRMILKNSLKEIGVTSIREAEDGEHGVQMYDGFTYDVVITDWNMPGMNGLDFLKYIRERDSRIPVMMVTTEARSDRVQLAIEAGVTDFMSKPFDRDLICERLEKFCTQGLAAEVAE